MTRMGPLLRENMNDRQKAVFDKITADGGRIVHEAASHLVAVSREFS